MEVVLAGSRDPLPTDVQGLPSLPRSFHVALDRCLDELELTLSELQRAAIETHVRLLLAWSRYINLTAIRDPGEVAVDHVADSLSAVPLLRARGVRAVLDVGSGGGFPGLPIAAALPADRGLLVESVAKKARFLNAAIASAGLEGTLGFANERAESLSRHVEHRERWPAVLARAVGSLAEVAEIGLPLVAEGGVLIVWKREPIAAEVRGTTLVAQLGGAQPSVVPAGLPERPANVLIVIEKVRRTPARFPRDPIVRRRRPDVDTSRVR